MTDKRNSLIQTILAAAALAKDKGLYATQQAAYGAVEAIMNTEQQVRKAA